MQNFMDAKSVMGELIGGTVTDVQVVCHFIDGHPLVCESCHRTCSMFPLVIDMEEPLLNVLH
jgi:hypothetical protein